MTKPARPAEPSGGSTPDLAVVEVADRFQPGELAELCDITVEAIEAGGGFGWLKPPSSDILERYWKGVLVVPERALFLAKLDGAVAGTGQLVRQPRNNEAQSIACKMTTEFVAPWARGYGLARMLIRTVEDKARSLGIRVLNLDVRESQTAAIHLYESLGYQHWGTHPFYAQVDGHIVPGRYYYKDLTLDAVT